MEILVTGGAGFIGSHLTERLIAEGHKVWVLDDVSTGSTNNLSWVLDNPNLYFVRGCVTDEKVVGDLVDKVDLVFHLAAVVGVKLVTHQPIYTLKTNIRGTEVVLNAASKKGKRVVVASTSEVYGTSEKLPYSEDDSIMLGTATNSRRGYACSKAIGEYFALAYSNELNLPVVIVRLFNTIGTRQVGRYGMVVPRFIRQALSGDAITVYGDGEQRRCFADVSEVVTSLLGLVAITVSNGQVYNIGNDQEVSINDLAKLVKELTDSRSAIVHIPYNEVYPSASDDVRRRVPDLAKLEATIGFKPHRSLVSTLTHIIEET